MRDFSRYAGRRGVVAVVFVTLGAFVESAGIVLLVPILAIVTDTGGTHGRLQEAAAYLFARLGLHTRFERLEFLLAIFAVMMILRAVVISVRDVTLMKLQIGFVEEQRRRVTRRLAAARWDVVARLRHARITHLMSSDIQQIGSAAQFLVQSGVSIVVLASQCLLAFALSPVLALLTFVFLFAGFAMLTPVLRRAQELGGFVTGTNLLLMNSTTQFMGGLKLAVSQNLQSGFVAEFDAAMRDITGKQVRYTRQLTNRRLVLGTLLGFVGAVTVLIGFGVLNIPTSVVITLLLILARINTPATLLQQGAQQVAQSLPAYDKVKELEAELAAVAPAKSKARDAMPGFGEGAIVFRAVGFTHEAVNDASTETVTLRNLDLTLTPGSFIGITGPSGAGKTTFADLLVGLFPPQQGEITIGGVLLRDAAITAWRDQISYVSQDPFLFHDTIRRNLLWVMPAASEEDMWNALRMAGADTMVRRMELGLETIVGERGTLVSGGERQRLALARALLRRPRLVVLDEATNAIDIAGERDVLERLQALSPRPTIVMIAHRMESLSLCERVLVLDQGRLRAAD